MALTEALLIQNIRSHMNEAGDANAATPLFSSGALDSIAMLNLITLVEDQTGIEIRADEVTLENFDTIERILRFTQARVG
jgi:acyl carrier protein